MARGVSAQGGVRVAGLRELVRDLEALGVQVADLKDAFGSIARQAAELASSFAPHRTGRLAASIRGSRAKNKAVVRAGGTRAPYAGAVNYGWAARGIKPAGFMQKADRAMRPRVQHELQAAIDRLITNKGLG